MVCGLLAATALLLTGCPTQSTHHQSGGGGDADLATADLREAAVPDLARADLAHSPPDLLAATLTVSWAPQAASAAQDGEDFVLSAVVDYTGPGAIDSVELVELSALGEALSYGQMQLHDDGRYTRTLSWADLQARKSLEFATSGSRTFYVAAAAGQAGVISVGRLVTLSCSSGGSACAGTCGSCGEPTGCSNTVNELSSCSTVCASAGKSCAACVGSTVLISYPNLTCTSDGTETHFGGACGLSLNNFGYQSNGSRFIACCCK